MAAPSVAGGYCKFSLHKTLGHSWTKCSSKSHLRVAKTAPWLIGSANGEAQKFVDPCIDWRNYPTTGPEYPHPVGKSLPVPRNECQVQYISVHYSTIYKGNHDLTWKPKVGKKPPNKGILTCQACGRSWRWKDRTNNLPKTICRPLPMNTNLPLQQSASSKESSDQPVVKRRLYGKQSVISVDCGTPSATSTFKPDPARHTQDEASADVSRRMRCHCEESAHSGSLRKVLALAIL